MPLHMESIDISGELAGVDSVLIVSCPVCPPISLAMQKNSPYMQVFKSGLDTPAFEDYIRSIREPLEARGVRTGVFRSYAPCPTMCLWTNGQRSRLRKRAQGYAAVVVLGCGTARYTVQQALRDTDCKVIQAMRTTGMTNAALKFEFPLTIKLEDKMKIGRGDKVEQVA
jgi:hypothetical protein